MNSTTIQNQATERKQACPACGALVPVHPDYVAWCDQCGWNLSPLQPEPPQNRLKALYQTVGQQQGQALLERFIREGHLQPTLTLSRVLAFVLAGFVHAITVLFALAGVVLLVRGWPGLLAIIVGLIALGIAWVLRPRFPKLEQPAAARGDFPALYALVDTISEALKAPKIDAIVIDESFSAALAWFGLRRRVLYLGLPLWAILDNDEKVALVAHEIAHTVNGDPNRTFFIGTAVMSLVQWHRLLYPPHIWPPDSGIYGIVIIPLNLILLGLSRMVLLVAQALGLLLYRDSQRAEYRADYLASTVGGTDAMLSLLEKLHFERAFTTTLQQVALSKDKSRNLFEELRQRIAATPARELERIKRVQQMEASRLDTTHPPTSYRIQFLQAHREKPEALPSTVDFAALDKELARSGKAIQQKLAEMYQDSLYY